MAVQGGRRVAARYVVRGRRVGFALGRYDHARALTIDPVVLAYSTYLGGGRRPTRAWASPSTRGRGVRDGLHELAELPDDDRGVRHELASRRRVRQPSSTRPARALVYSTYIGGSDGTVGQRLGDRRRRAAAPRTSPGLTQSTDFPTTAGALRRRRRTPSHGSAFVSKLDPDRRCDSSTRPTSRATGDRRHLRDGHRRRLRRRGVRLGGRHRRVDLPDHRRGGADQPPDGARTCSSRSSTPPGTALTYSTLRRRLERRLRPDQTGTSLAIDSAAPRT